MPLPDPDDHELGRDPAGRLDLHRQLQHLRGNEFLGPPRGRRGRLALSVHPELTPREVRDLVRATARPFPAVGASLEQRRVRVHGASVQPHGHAGRPAGVLLHQRDLRGGHARRRRGPRRGRIGRRASRAPARTTRSPEGVGERLLFRDEGRAPSADELVAQSVDGQDERGRRASSSSLRRSHATWTSTVRVVAPRPVPDPVQQLVPAQRGSPVGDEELQEPELLRRELDSAAVAANLGARRSTSIEPKR